jgi:GH3 auxin-responsive promoter
LEAGTARLRRKLRGSAAEFRRLLGDPRGVQEAALLEILRANRDTEYGRSHRFASISTRTEFQRRVPAVRYEDLRARIERTAAGERGVLVSERVVAFEETGGSSGGAKLVPYTEASFAAFQRGLRPWLDDLYDSHPGLLDGTAYWVVSPACREPRRTPGGIAIGLAGDAAYLGEELAADVAASLSVPPATGKVRDIGVWRDLTLGYLLADENLALISVWSPTLLLELLAYARRNSARLTDRFCARRSDFDVPEPLRSRLPVADPERVRRVRDALESDDGLERLWPRLQVISCWNHASSKRYARAVEQLFPSVHVQGKGLLATEGMTSIPLAGCAAPVLALQSGFYEFIASDGSARFADEVEDGEEYEVLLTNASGFYRYRIGDRVRIRGFAERTPTLEFVGRSGVASDLCGEKLTEDFVLRALDPLRLCFAAIAPIESPRGYVLLLDASEIPERGVDALAAHVDSALHANPQYALARKLEQLAPLRAVRCVYPLESWTSRGLERGQMLGNIKPPALLVNDAWHRTFQRA